MFYTIYAKQKNNNDRCRTRYYYDRGFYTHTHFTMAVEFSKSANSAAIVESSPVRCFFVWRQLEFAFFGALTSVGALFIFIDRKDEHK